LQVLRPAGYITAGLFCLTQFNVPEAEFYIGQFVYTLQIGLKSYFREVFYSPFDQPKPIRNSNFKLDCPGLIVCEVDNLNVLAYNDARNLKVLVNGPTLAITKEK